MLQASETPKDRISEALRCQCVRLMKPTTCKISQHEAGKGKNSHLVFAFASREVLFANDPRFKNEIWGDAMPGQLFSFAFLPELLMWIQCQAFDIQDGGALLWKQLVAAFGFSAARAGSRQTLPNVLVDVVQNKCGFHQIPGSDLHHTAVSSFVKHGG